MNVYKLIQDSDTYDSLLASREARQRLDEFGKPQAQSWEPLPVDVYSVGRSGDFPSLRRDVPVFSEGAWQVLRPLIELSVEALPLIGTKDSYLAINVLDIADCLDHSRAKISLLPSGGVMSVDKYVFKDGCLNNRHIFKLPETAVQEVLVSEEFKQLVERSGLKGLMFRKVA